MGNYFTNQPSLRLMRTLQEAAPGIVHRDLQRELQRFAQNEGYNAEFHDFPSYLRPDVLRVKIEDGMRYVFLGDAKDADNETTSNSETVYRIRNYVETFAHQLRQYPGGPYDPTQIAGGVIAIMTTDEKAAIEWQTALATLSRNAGMVKMDSGDSLHFQVHRYGEYYLILNTD